MVERDQGGNMKELSCIITAAMLLGANATAAHAAPAAPATFSLKQLTLETAQRAAQAALEKCRKDGAQVAVAVVDRASRPLRICRAHGRRCNAEPTRAGRSLQRTWSTQLVRSQSD